MRRDGLTLLRTADFDWAMHLQGVWTDPPYDVPEFQSGVRKELNDELDQLRNSPKDASRWAGSSSVPEVLARPTCCRSCVAQRWPVRSTSCLST